VSEEAETPTRGRVVPQAALQAMHASLSAGGPFSGILGPLREAARKDKPVDPEHVGLLSQFNVIDKATGKLRPEAAKYLSSATVLTKPEPEPPAPVAAANPGTKKRRGRYGR